MTDPFSSMHEAVFAGLGQEATYQPVTGDALPCRVIVDQNLLRWGDSIEIGNANAVISVTRADVTDRPRRGSSFTVGTVEYQVDQVIASDQHVHQCLAVEA